MAQPENGGTPNLDKFFDTEPVPATKDHEPKLDEEIIRKLRAAIMDEHCRPGRKPR
jgi:hypothetical protein